jgi:transposase
MKEMVTLTVKEQRRLMVINEIERGDMVGREATGVLGTSLRHLRRMIAAYRKEGAVALAHGNRGRKPVNAIRRELRQRIVELAGSKYLGFNQQHFTELLAEREGICLSRSSVRNILLESGIKSPRKRRAPKHRSRRARYSKEGMLLQIDGSPHDWLQGRGPKMSLIGAIDDATGKVPYALFREQEDSCGYFLLLKGIASRQGIPQALYHDRHSIFEVSAYDREHQTIQEQLSDKPVLTQFGRLMKELGITPISARSPQAKGRIERLWGTFQDRLVNELRLAGIRTLEEANCFLEGFLGRYNSRFAVPAEQPGSAYRSAEGMDLEVLFCFKYERVAGADNVVRFRGDRLQILPSPERSSYARCTVQIHKQMNSTLKVYYQGRYLDTRPAPVEATKIRETVSAKTVTPVTRSRQVTKPASNHPWRRWIPHQAGVKK